jgi:hypothetical protein
MFTNTSSAIGEEEKRHLASFGKSFVWSISLEDKKAYKIRRGLKFFAHYYINSTLTG